ncbi:MAG: cation transporting ATPase C-terminal domain-containing protein, partial [Candidatus Hodarchaeota archaeon]
LTVSVLFELFQVFVTRTPAGKSMFKHNPVNNPFLLLAVGIAFGGQLLIMYVPAAANVFELTPLSLLDWLKMLGIVIVGIIILDIAKLLQASTSKNP